MTSIILRRLAAIPLVLIAVTMIMQALYLLLPGDPAVALAGGENASIADVERIRKELNLDAPFFVAYWDWLSSALQLDFGASLLTGISVSDEILRRLPATLSLGLTSMTIALVVGFVLGVVSSVRRGSWLDRVVLATTSAGMAVPAFLIAIILIVIFAIQLGVLPAVGYVAFTESPLEWARGMVLPAIALAAAPAARIARTLRGSLIHSLDSDYVRTAWAKGASPRTVLVKHALKNSLIPTVTVLGLLVEVIIGGSVVVENVFSIPGLGTYIGRAATSADLPAIQSIVVVFAIFTVVANLLVDVAYAALNPKVRVS
jgi:peptide/nickel transport system permease protein